jgi:hypothetical protein
VWEARLGVRKRKRRAVRAAFLFAFRYRRESAFIGG